MAPNEQARKNHGELFTGHVLTQLSQLERLTGNFCGARPRKRESNQRRPLANRL